MDTAQSDSDETRPTDSDLRWTDWALQTLREAVELDMRCKRLIERQQQSTSASGPKEPPDFGLIQSRLTRSIRLSIALTERIRADYLMRKTKRVKSGAQERHRKRREWAFETAIKAMATPTDGEGAKHLRFVVWEKLVEDEVLDARIDTMSPAEFVQAICDKIGRPPPSIPLPQSWDDVAEAMDVEPAEHAEDAADREPAEGWPRPSDESEAGRSMPEPPKPDSS
jgi:hypothetical protein